jgi:hypothetical protein
LRISTLDDQDLRRWVEVGDLLALVRYQEMRRILAEPVSFWSVWKYRLRMWWHRLWRKPAARSQLDVVDVYRHQEPGQLKAPPEPCDGSCGGGDFCARDDRPTPTTIPGPGRLVES